MNYWKLGCRWGSKKDGLPLFYDVLEREKIVISWVDKDFGNGNAVLLTDGFTPIGIAITKSERKSILERKDLEETFNEKQIDFHEHLFYYEAEIYPINSPDFKYEYQVGISRIHQKDIIKNISKLLELVKVNSIGGKLFKGMNGEGLPKLDVAILSENFANLLSSLKRNSGQMLGVFGQWGRGKTFFMNEVGKKLNIGAKESEFYYLPFHAWKYQDTEGVWAYLYQQIAEQYLTHKKGKYYIDSKLKEYWLLSKLNFIRNGFGDAVLFLMLLVLTVTIIVIYPELIKDIQFWKAFLITSVSTQTLLFLKKTWKLGDKGRRLVKKYTHKPTFNKLLGVQAEIQEELKYVLKAWIPVKKNSPHKRLLLFVDDIDRCKEERIIQVIDALRVMLEDEEIISRVLIVAAIDENILERAILFKYRNLNIETRSQTLVKEYLDKLFIACIKLPALEKEEKNEILDNYFHQLGSNMIENKEEIKDNETAIGNDVVIERSNEDDIDRINEKKNDSFNEQENYIVSKDEAILLKEYGQKLDGEITPRQLRIFVYRYLLAKNLGRSFNGDKTPNKEWCRYILKEIVNSRNKNFIKESTSNEEKVSSIKEVLGITKKLEKATNKIVKVIAPY